MSPSEKIELDRWKAADPRHERAFARHEAAWTCFDRPMVSGEAGILIAALTASKARRQRRQAWRLAAGFAACACVGLLWYQSGVPSNHEIPKELPASNAVVTLPEMRMLPDGSTVELKPGAEILVEFGPAKRGIILKWGEAYFQVAKNALPFVVAAKGIEVRAVGTAFSVQLDSRTVGVVVAEGRVSVEKSARRSPTGAMPATPDETAVAPQTIATVDAANRLVVDLQPEASKPAVVVPVTPPELTDRLAWRAARLEFTDTPLATAVSFFNRHSRNRDAMRLVVDPKDAMLARLEVSGYFRADNVEAFVLLVEQTLCLKAERQNGQIMLRRTR